MNRGRIHGFKRVLTRYRDEGVPDAYLAGIVVALRGAPIGAVELDRIIASDLAAALLNDERPRDQHPVGA
jgi:hypothetical protein